MIKKLSLLSITFPFPLPSTFDIPWLSICHVPSLSFLPPISPVAATFIHFRSHLPQYAVSTKGKMLRCLAFPLVLVGFLSVEKFMCAQILRYGHLQMVTGIHQYSRIILFGS